MIKMKAGLGLQCCVRVSVRLRGRVFVGGMPFTYEEEQVRDYWSFCGAIESLEVRTTVLPSKVRTEATSIQTCHQSCPAFRPAG